MALTRRSAAIGEGGNNAEAKLVLASVSAKIAERC
jgi:hypothetical protein